VLAKAVKEAEAAHLKFPLSRGIAHQYGEALLAAGQLEQAASTCATRRSCTATISEVYDILAQAYAKQGKLALQHIARWPNRMRCRAAPCRRWTSWRWRARRPMPRSTTSR
jgi:predicted Zn-dependent protease